MEKKEMSGVDSAQWKEAEAMWEAWDEERQLALYRKAVAAGAVDSDSLLHPMDEFNAVMAGYAPLEIARMAIEGDFDLWSEYFYIDSGKNLVSVCPADLPDFLALVSDEVIAYLAKHPEAAKA